MRSEGGTAAGAPAPPTTTFDSVSRLPTLHYSQLRAAQMQPKRQIRVREGRKRRQGSELRENR
eukprot:2289902-Rhodomonas_salina.2